jgi:hypothetical protein
MITISQLTELLGWASVVNITYLFVASFTLMFMRGTVVAIHSKLMKIEEHELSSKYFNFLSYYKIATLVFFVAPYIALKIMGY